MLKNRVLHVVLGTTGGLACWLLAEVLAGQIDERALLFLWVLVVVAFGGALTMLAEIGPRAAPYATALAAPVAGLALWGATRFASVEGFLNSEHVLAALAVLAIVPLPFLMARLQGGRWGWLDYGATVHP